MKKKTKIALITALMLIVLGCALSYGALASLGFDWSGLNMTVGDLAVSFS